MPYETAIDELSDAEVVAFNVMFGEMEGGTFDYKTFTWKQEEAGRKGK